MTHRRASTVAGLGGTFAPTWYDTPASALPAKPKDDKRRHFVREEVEALQAAAHGRRAADARSAEAVLGRSAVVFEPDEEVAARCRQGSRSRGGRRAAAEAALLRPSSRARVRSTANGIPTVCVDRVNRSYLAGGRGHRSPWELACRRRIARLNVSMRRRFLEAIDERVLVCDGAMGTQLYAKGVFINRCFESLNLSHAGSGPRRPRGIPPRRRRRHRDQHVRRQSHQAARVRAERQRRRHQPRAGARLARARRPASDAFVAGAIGPLGVRVEPWGKTGIDEAEQYFKEQAEALLEGGVDLFMLETFRDLNEIGAAIAAVRRLCDLPIVAQMTTEEDGNSLDGTPPEQFAPVLLERGADVVGVNCSVGPAPMLETDRAARRGHRRRGSRRSPTPASRATSKAATSTCARRNTWRRTRAASSPAACAWSAAAAARRPSTSGRSARPCKRMAPRRARAAGRGPTRARCRWPTRRTRSRRCRAREKSRLAAALAAGEFVVSVELVPPRGLVVRGGDRRCDRRSPGDTSTW